MHIAPPRTLALELLTTNDNETDVRVAKKRPYIGTKEAAAILEVSATVVKRLAARGEIPSAYRIDDHWWIMLRSDVEKLAAKRKQNGVA